MKGINRKSLLIAGLMFLVVIIFAASFLGARQIWLLYHPTPTTTPVANTSKATTLLNDPSYAATLKKLDQANSTEKFTIDTDGDGVPDAVEINKGTDPTVAGAAGDNKPLLGKQVTDLSTYTNRYLSLLSEDTPKDQIYSKESLMAYVNTMKGPLLPYVPKTAIKTSIATGKAAVITYLNNISPLQNKLLQTVTNQDIEAAVQQHFQGESQPLDDIITKLTKNIEILQNTTAPTEVVELHLRLVAASQSLLTNVKLLPLLTSDMVGGLIGSKNIEDLAPVFQDVTNQIKKLDTKYNQ